MQKEAGNQFYSYKGGTMQQAANDTMWTEYKLNNNNIFFYICL